MNGRRGSSLTQQHKRRIDSSASCSLGPTQHERECWRWVASSYMASSHRCEVRMVPSTVGRQSVCVCVCTGEYVRCYSYRLSPLLASFHSFIQLISSHVRCTKRAPRDVTCRILANSTLTWKRPETIPCQPPGPAPVCHSWYAASIAAHEAAS